MLTLTLYYWHQTRDWKRLDRAIKENGKKARNSFEAHNGYLHDSHQGAGSHQYKCHLFGGLVESQMR